MSIHILLTGSTGFIGRNLKEHLEKNPQYALLAPSRSDFDLLDSAHVEIYLKLHKPDIIIHSANCNNFLHQLSPYDILDGNLRMFFNLERCNELFGKLIYFGSGAEYDKNTMPPLVSEKDFGRSIPSPPYDFSKYVMRKTISNSGNIFELCLFGVFGKYEEYNRRFISNNICRNLKKMPITLSKNARFDYLYIDDLCYILDWFIENSPKHKCYNVSSSKPIELLELAEIINKVSPFKSEIHVAQAGFQRDYTGDNSRLLSEIGSFSFTEINTAINALYEYYRKTLTLINI